MGVLCRSSSATDARLPDAGSQRSRRTSSVCADTTGTLERKKVKIVSREQFVGYCRPFAVIILCIDEDVEH